MEFDELIYHRESVRDYDPSRIVPRETIMKILDSGRLAPSAGNRQPWEFLVVSSKEKLKAVKTSYQRPWFHNAPHVLAVKGFIDQSWTRIGDNYNSLETDLAIAMDHIILSATNSGVGTCWIIAFNPDILGEALDLRENERVFAITPLGYPEKKYDHREKNRKKIEEVVRFI